MNQRPSTCWRAKTGMDEQNIFRPMRNLVEDQQAISVHQLYRKRAFGLGATRILVGDVTVPITWHPGTRGGSWPSWQCPRCKRGAYLVYGADLVCRRCARLDYATTHVKSPAPWQARRLRKRLGADPQLFALLPSRRERRGWAALKYDRLAAAIAAAECRVLSALARAIAAAERRKERLDDGDER